MTRKPKRRQLWLALWISCVSLSLPATDVPRYRIHPIQFRGRIDRIIPADVDGDGLKDLVSASGRRLEIRFQRADAGFDETRPDAQMLLPGESVGWDLDRTPGKSGLRILALVDSREILAWRVDRDRGAFSPPVKLLTGLKGFLPRGARYLHFVRDMNGDTRADLILPASGGFDVYLCGSDAEYVRGPTVRSEVNLRSALSETEDLMAGVGQSLRVPSLELRDVNADGLSDLITSTQDHLDVYLASEKGVFPVEPTSSLNIAAERARLGSFDPERIDYSNLTGVVSLTCQTELADLTGDDREDLLLRAGGKVSLFRGRREGLDLKRPYQILKSGGNVLTALLHDEDEDGLDDLWLVRIEAVSLADVFLWLVVSGSVDLEAFLYRNDGKLFSRRPDRRITLTIEFPSLPSLGRLDEDLKEKRKRVQRVPVARGGLAGSGASRDLLVLRDGGLQFYYDSISKEDEGDFLMNILGYRRDKNEYTLNVEQLMNQFASGENRDLDALGDRRPDFEVKMEGADGTSDMVLLDMNGDGRIDVLTLLRREDEVFRASMVLSETE